MPGLLRRVARFFRWRHCLHWKIRSGAGSASPRRPTASSATNPERPWRRLPRSTICSSRAGHRLAGDQPGTATGPHRRPPRHDAQARPRGRPRTHHAPRSNSKGPKPAGRSPVVPPTFERTAPATGSRTGTGTDSASAASRDPRSIPEASLGRTRMPRGTSEARRRRAAEALEAGPEAGRAPPRSPTHPGPAEDRPPRGGATGPAGRPRPHRSARTDRSAGARRCFQRWRRRGPQQERARAPGRLPRRIGPYSPGGYGNRNGDVHRHGYGHQDWDGPPWTCR